MRCALVSRFQGFNISVASCDACFMRCALVSKFHRFAVSRDGIMLCYVMLCYVMYAYGAVLF
jgi:hypothetical protein